MKQLKVGVIGLGHLGKHHARIYNELPQAHLVGLCDIDKRHGAAKAHELDIPFFNDYRDLLTKVEAVSKRIVTAPKGTFHQST